MIAFNGDRIRLGGRIVVVGRRTGKIGKRQIGLSVAEAVV